MKTITDSTVVSAELPVFIIEGLRATEPAARPRVEVVFDPHTRLILGFRLDDGGTRPIAPRRGPRSGR